MSTVPTVAADEQPLAGVTVVDFTRVYAGPYCTRLMADLGANIIKIERPGEGDEVRYAGLQLDPEHPNQSMYFVRMNVGKRSIAIDLANPGARDLVLELVRKADVVVENFSPGVMAKYKLDYAALKAVKPELIYCSISGFGQTGPLSSLQAYAHLINAISGMMELERGGVLPPRAANLQAADVLAGAHAFGAINAALVRSARTGKGAFIDVSMLECMVFADDMNYQALLNGGTVPRRTRVGMIVHPVGDRHVAMQIGGAPTMWPRMCQLMNRPDLVDDARFTTPQARRDNWDTLVEILTGWLESFGTADKAIDALTKARIPNVPMLQPEEVIAHPHLAQREFFPTVPHPSAGTARITAPPFQLDGRAIKPAGPPPYRIGEHTRQILADTLGYGPERIAALEAQGVVAAG